MAESRKVIANRPQGSFLSMHQKFRAFVAGYGCVQEDVKVFTDSGLVAVGDLNHSNLYLSWNKNENQFQLFPGTRAYPKGKANLYRVVTSQGEFVAAGHHHVFCECGKYRPVADISVGSFLPSFSLNQHLTNSAFDFESCALNVPDWKKKVLNSLSDYSNVNHPHDLPPHVASKIDIDVVPSQIYAQEYGRNSYLYKFLREDGFLELGSKHNHLDQSHAHACMQGLGYHALHPDLILVDCVFSFVPVHIFDYIRQYLISRVKSFYHRIMILLNLSRILFHLLKAYNPRFQSCTTPVTILSIEKQQKQEWFFDLTVPFTHNYITADGSIHHNSGKTWVTGMSSCINYAKFPKVNQGYFAPTYPQIRDIFYPTIEEVAAQFGFNVDIKFGNKEVHFYRGENYLGTTLCRSMDKPETIVGFKIGHATIDELDTLSTEKAELAWQKIIARMRYNVEGLKNGVDIATTPEGFKFTYKAFVKQLMENPDLKKNYGIIHASTYENERNLPPDYIPSLFEAYPEQLRDAYIDGQFVNLTSGTVYYGFDREKNNSNEEIEGFEPLYIGMDFNVDNMAATIYVQRGRVWHAVEELKDIFDTPEMARIINEKWGKRRNITIYPDASGKNRKSVGASESDLSILRSYGFEIKAKSRNPFVKDRINAANKAFEVGYVMVNCKNCPTTAACLEQQAYDKNGEPDKKSGFDHQNDATTYPIAFEMPIKKPDYNNITNAMPAGFLNPKLKV